MTFCCFTYKTKHFLRYSLLFSPLETALNGSICCLLENGGVVVVGSVSGGGVVVVSVVSVDSVSVAVAVELLVLM